MSVAHSSQGFIRALKAPSDPPVYGGPLKIAIARRAWNDVSFYVPSKSEVIVDWILNKLLKERGNEPSQNPLLDPHYWNLLYDVLSFTNLSSSGVTSRPLKSWLPTVLNRTPVAPIFIRFLDLLGGLEHDLQNQLSQVFSSCFGILWPLAVQKIGTEALLECFGALLNSLSLCARNDGIARVGGNIISSYRNSLWNSFNKKKIYLLFLQTHLAIWLNGSLIEAQSDPHRLLLEASYEAGIDTILNLDILRQARDSKLENSLFDAVATTLSSNPTLLTTLPRLLTSYIQAVKKYRGSLFGQGSNQPHGATVDESNASGMRFFVACNSLLDHAGPTSQTWSTRVRLLSLVDRENIFARGQLDALLVLNQNVELALNTLEDTQNAEHITFSTLAIDSLSALARMDYNFILPTLPRVLSAILVHKSSPAYLKFLNLLLSYHTKTRTMDAYVTSLLTALSPQRKSVVPGGAPAVYQLCHSGPLMDAAHLDSLSKAIYGFLAGTQASPTVRLVVDSLSQAWEHLYDAKGVSDSNDESPSKKSRLTGGSATVSQLNSLAIELSLSTRLSSIVISSLPLNSAPETTRQEIRESLSNLRNKFVSRSITKIFKCIRKTDEASAWGLQVTATAFLRLRYALNASRYLSLDPSADSKLSSKAQAIVNSDGLLPELRVEIFRTLLDLTGSWDLAETRAVLDHILAYLAGNSPGEDICWSGNSHQLSFEGNGIAASSLALLHMVIERWLPVIESAASPTQLRTLIHHIIRINLDMPGAPNMPELQTPSLLAQMLHSAQFWEHPNIRVTFLALMNEATLGLDEISDMSQISSVIPIYRLLLLFPMEYISRPSRAELIKRAIVADLFATQWLKDSDDAINDILPTLVILRVFLNRVFAHGGFTEQSVQQLCEYLGHTMVGGGAHVQHDIELSSATTNLMESLFSELFQRSTTSNPETTPTLVAFLDGVQAGSLGLADFRSRCIIQMIEVLEASFSLINFPQEMQDLLLAIYRKLSTAILSQIQRFTGAGTSTDLLGQRSSAMELWCALLIFGRWFGMTESPLPSLGRGFLVEAIKISTQHQVSSDAWDTLLVAASAILLQELHYVTEIDYLPHLSLITASHLTFSAILGASGRKRMDINLARACKVLSSSHFSHILDLVGEGLTTPGTSDDNLVRFIELSILLLHNHPQGTLKCIQNHTTQCLNAFAGRSLFTEGPVSLRIQVLEFIVQHCSDRSAVLRLGDLSSIWTILARFLSGSRVHDNETSTGIFHKIVTIVSALVRLRRDLVTLTLPHLGVVLRQLLMSIRSVRPLLGSKQTTLITDTQPKWISSRSPLGAEEGKMLARLLEALTSKSIIRNNATVTEAQKAESLAKPFSKHASYVLKAYIEAMNDPLCVLHSDLRKELQRGLYALCSMMSDHSRDAMMLSALDAGGKTTMKTLWKEYEKQKYVGKG